MYAIENAETMNPYCSADRFVSRMMVGYEQREPCCDPCS